MKRQPTKEGSALPVEGPIHMNSITPADKVWVQVELTINTGSYENVKIQADRTLTIEPGNNPYNLQDEIIRQTLKLLEAKKEEILD